MIKIEVSKNKNCISNIKISGHSGYEEYGRDIVCAAISSIVATSVNGILSFKETIKVTDDENILEISVLESDEITRKLLENMIDLFKSVEMQYKKNVKVLLKGE